MSWATIRVPAMTVFVLLLVGGAATDRTTPSVFACGPFIDFQVFTNLAEPDTPSFVKGELGIIHRTFRRRYLLAAWRTLRDRPLTRLEQRAYLGSRVPSERRDPVQTWLDARIVVPGVKPLADRPEQVALLTAQNVYAYFTNCGDDAFVSAAATLADRRTRQSAGLPLADWVKAQDVVFSNCGRRSVQEAAIPVALPDEAPALARADRAYQIAAARFYAGQLTEAEAAFTAIARDRSSPWWTLAPYLAARAMVRQGTAGGPDAVGDPAALTRAEAALDAILKDKTRRSIHDNARRLRQVVRTKLRPSEVLLEVTGRLVDPAGEAQFGERLADYDYLLNWKPTSSPDVSELSATASDAEDLLAWTSALQGQWSDPAALLERWDRTRAETWLVAALMVMAPEHPRTAELLDVTASIAPQSPAFPTLAFHRARLLLRLGRIEDARAVVDRALGMPGLPVSSINLFKAARLLTAQSLDQFLADAVRTSVGEIRDIDDVRRLVPYQRKTANAVLDLDALAVLNEKFPISLLRRIAANAEVPASVRRELHQAIFTRALLLSDLGLVRELLPEFRRAEPSLRTWLAPLDTADDQRLRDEGALLLLRTPGLRPYVPALSFRDNWLEFQRSEGLTGLESLRDNWWCRFEQKPASYYTPNLRGVGAFSEAQAGLHGTTAVPSPAFLTEEDRRRAADERRALEQVDTGPNELGRRVLDWARRNPADPRVPEALHRVVRATRVGCTTDATGPISRSAFELLHTRYPRSPWTARTPYWFK